MLFILSLPVVLRPRTFRDTFLLGLAALSPMTVYALERANNDLVVYLLIVWASALLSAIVISYLRRMIFVKGSLAELRIANADSADSTQIDAEAPNSGVAEQTDPPALRVTRLRVSSIARPFS